MLYKKSTTSTIKIWRDYIIMDKVHFTLQSLTQVQITHKLKFGSLYLQFLSNRFTFHIFTPIQSDFANVVY
jgi:hypothetical protein